MTDDRRVKAYTEATELTQNVLDETFLGGETEICTVATLTKGDVVLRFSDRAKYVGNDYYEGRAKFPEIVRTIGELISPSIQFSEMEVKLNNVDGFYNSYLSGGANYISFIGARIEIKIGLRDLSATYFTLFDGTVPDEDGFAFDRESITLRARDKANELNKATGLPFINSADFPSAPQESLGKIIPFVLGDWVTGYNLTRDIGSVSISSGSLQYNVIQDGPDNFYGGIIGYPVGEGYFVFCVGGGLETSYTPETIQDCHIKRGASFLRVKFNNVPKNLAGFWGIQVLNYEIFGGEQIPYIFQDGDTAAISVKIPYAVGKYSNPILLAKEVLKTLGDVVDGDLDTASWLYLSTKSSPPQSDMTSIKARIWIGEEKDKVLEVVLGMLEQIRVEMYWDRNQKIALGDLHPEDFHEQGSYRIEQIHLDEQSLKLSSDQRNFFNRAMSNYSYSPVVGKNSMQTGYRRNANSVNKSGKTISKAIDIPMLYVEADVIHQLDEFIRFYSTSQEYIEANISWTALLKDLSEIVMLNYRIGSLQFNNKPMKIRTITFIPSNGCLRFKLLSLANFPYTGYAPDNAAKMLSSETQPIVDA